MNEIHLALVRFDITGHMCTLPVVCGLPFCVFFAPDMSMRMGNDFAKEQPVSAKGKPRWQLLQSRPRSDCEVLWEIKLIKLHEVRANSYLNRRGERRDANCI